MRTRDEVVGPGIFEAFPDNPTLVENVPDYAIFLLDADGHITESTPGSATVESSPGQGTTLFGRPPLGGPR